MKIRSLILSKNQTSVAARVSVADDFFSRLRGYIGRTEIEKDEGILFPRCQSVHMWFMRTSLDIVFVSGQLKDGRSELRVTSVRENVKPWMILPVFDSKASHAFELAPGKVAQHSIQKGDTLWFG